MVVVDDEDRENEGDLIMAAEYATPERIAFFVRHTSGVICVPLTGERCDELGLPLMVEHNTESHRTAFTDTVDFRHGTTTGISATDRALTIRALIDPATRPGDLARPGHIFPLRYRPGGVLKRAGHTEAAVDLARLAGLYPAGVLCEIVNDDGSMARVPDLERFCTEHSLPMISIADLIRYRRRTEKLVRRVAEARIPTAVGRLHLHRVTSRSSTARRISRSSAATCRAPTTSSSACTASASPAMCSVRSSATAARSSRRRWQKIASEDKGVVVYLRGHEGRGIGLGHKLRAYSLQDRGRDTVDANTELGLPVDSREYGIGAHILVDLGVSAMRLMTNNPAKYGGLEGFGLEIVERVPLSVRPNPENIHYLRTKRERMGHLLRGPGRPRPRIGREPMTTYEGKLRGDGLRVAVVCARFNDFITDRLLAGARDGLVRHGVDDALDHRRVGAGSVRAPARGEATRRLGRVRRRSSRSAP